MKKNRALCTLSSLFCKRRTNTYCGICSSCPQGSRIAASMSYLCSRIVAPDFNPQGLTLWSDLTCFLNGKYTSMAGIEPSPTELKFCSLQMSHEIWSFQQCHMEKVTLCTYVILSQHLVVLLLTYSSVFIAYCWLEREVFLPIFMSSCVPTFTSWVIAARQGLQGLVSH